MSFPKKKKKKILANRSCGEKQQQLTDYRTMKTTEGRDFLYDAWEGMGGGGGGGGVPEAEGWGEGGCSVGWRLKIKNKGRRKSKWMFGPQV